MGFGNKPKLTGIDFLIGVADKASREEPFAMLFGEMVLAFAIDESLPHSAEARRPLDPHEQTAVGIIYTAYEIAKKRGDKESVDEVVRFGCFLLARWQRYLEASFDEDGNRV